MYEFTAVSGSDISATIVEGYPKNWRKPTVSRESLGLKT